MTDTEDLRTWLRAQLDEEERGAQEADVKQGDPDWRVTPVVISRGEHFTVRSVRDARPVARVQRLDGDDGEPAAILDGRAVAEHIARWDPARALAVAGATREVLDLYEAQLAAQEENGARFVQLSKQTPTPHEELTRVKTHGWELAGRVAALQQSVRLLALVYAGRGGYREEWRP